MKRFTAMLLILTMAIVFAACSNNVENDAATEDAADDDTVILRLGHIQSENDLWHEGSLKFKEEVESLSDGKMTVEIYPNSSLGGDRDMVESMQSGTVDFALVAGVLGNFSPSIQLLELPYLFADEEEYRTVIHGEIGEEIIDRVLEDSDVRILEFWDRGPRHVTANKPIETLDDIKGLKIRLPEIKAMEATWKEMGASPTTMAWDEVYTALDQNVIEAQENPIPFIYGGAIHEVQDYLSLTAHKYEYVTLAMSDLTWNKLTEEQQEIISEAAKIATDYENELVAEQTEELLQEMENEGLTVVEPDIDEFAEAARDAHEEVAKTIDIDLYNRILEELK
ncbi:MAG TPA: TRAP transporter substrate-binding protein [Pseudogracilibacillus sp.]|nr:TRAP transporter substrate-binding protein [Pseudogracilibacillus sp.]